MSGRVLERASIKRVVVRGTNWVGDAVMTIPALRELRRVLPQAHITLATRSWAEGLFSDADFLDEILVYDRPRRDFRAALRQAEEWRRRSFDLAVLFQNAFEAALIARLAKVPARVGYRTDRRGALLTHPIAVPSWRGERHEVFYYLNIVHELERLLDGASLMEEREPRFELQVSDARKREARAMLNEHGARLDVPLVALCPGSTNSRAKRWPAESYAALADRFVEEAGAQVLLVGARDELDVSLRVSSLMRHKADCLNRRDHARAARQHPEHGRSACHERHRPGAHRRRIGAPHSSHLRPDRPAHDEPFFKTCGDYSSPAGLRAVHAARLSY